MSPPRLRWVVILAVVSFMVVVMISSFSREIVKIHTMRNTLDQKMDELVTLERKTQEMKRDIEYYKSPEGIERLAREHYGLLKEGEQMYKIEVRKEKK